MRGPQEPYETPSARFCGWTRGLSIGGDEGAGGGFAGWVCFGVACCFGECCASTELCQVVPGCAQGRSVRLPLFFSFTFDVAVRWLGGVCWAGSFDGWSYSRGAWWRCRRKGMYCAYPDRGGLCELRDYASRVMCFGGTGGSLSHTVRRSTHLLPEHIKHLSPPVVPRVPFIAPMVLSLLPTLSLALEWTVDEKASPILSLIRRCKWHAGRAIPRFLFTATRYATTRP